MIMLYILVFISTNITTLFVNGQHAKQVATIPGQLVIGALFSIREQPTMRTAAARTCGEVREQYGIHRVEAAFQTIDAINRDPNILPNISLGIEIRDSCWYSAIALEQSIEFIRDAMAASEEKAFASNTNTFFLNSPSGHSFDDPDHDHLLRTERILGLFPASPFAGAPRFNVSTPCPKATKKAKNIVGVIGPASSTNSIQVQNLLQLFNIPQIGYSATSKELSGKNFFKFFLRVVPSDFHQAQVMTSLFRYYNWTYISVIYTDGSYGSGLMEIFKTNAQDVGICIAYMESIPPNGDDELFDSVVHSLLAYRNARVVACFCEGSSVRALLQAKKRLNITTEFLLVGSDGWSDRPDVVKGLEKEAQGSLSVRIYSQFVNEFDDYYFKLNPVTNLRNPWFPEFWEMKMNCSLRSLTGQVIVHPNNVTFTKQCKGDERLSDFIYKRRPRYKQDNKMSFVVKSIWTMAHGLHSMQRAICKNVSGLCNDMLPVNGSILLQHLNQAKFIWNNEIVEFDENGDPPGRYDIMNYQELKKGEFDYVQVGRWSSGGDDRQAFRIDQPIQWPRKREMVIQSNYTEIKVLNKHLSIPESVCSKPCPRGHAKNIQSDSVKCCWICVPCRENEYLTKEEKCRACAIGTWPNDDLTGCTPIPIEFLRWTDTVSMVALTIAIIGIIMTLFAMVVFIQHNHTPVVKATTRELTYMIMFGMFLCHGTTFALIAKPTKLTCYITRILPGVSFAIMYGSLVTKTNRIARILAGSKKRIITKRPRFMSATAQVVITWLLISIEVGIIVTVLIREPADKMLKYPVHDRVVLTCNTKVLGISAPLGFDFVLIGFCTLYAIKTRNVPENFNEAKFIGFTMYTTLVIWIAFVPIYYNSDENVITLSLCISFSAIVALILLYFPKLYIILFKPEKNNRSFFTTAKNVRCHIGYMTSAPPVSQHQPSASNVTATNSSMAVSRHSSHSTSEFSMESPRNHSIDGHFRRPDQSTISTIHNTINSGTSGIGSHLNHIGPRRPDLKGPRHKPKGFFSRLRISKQDKIAANVQEHIRAVRAAEALDRQTARGRRFNMASQSFSERHDEPETVLNTTASNSNTITGGGASSTSGGGGGKHDDMITVLSRQDSATRRIRIIHLLRRTFGDELERVPQFAALVNCLKVQCAHTFIDSETQTNGNETNGRMLTNGSGGGDGVRDSGYDPYRNSIPILATNSSTLRYRHGSSTEPLSKEQRTSFNNTCSSARSSIRSIGKPIHCSALKTISSDESILSVAGSVVVEENISSESEHSSQDSGVYKNIIINLGNLVSSDQISLEQLSSTSNDPQSSQQHQQQQQQQQYQQQQQQRQQQQQLQQQQQSYLLDEQSNNGGPGNGTNNGNTRTGQELVGILKKSK